jgi:hypothetical protein
MLTAINAKIPMQNKEATRTFTWTNYVSKNLGIVLIKIM